jgi:hypothetical protein
MEEAGRRVTIVRAEVDGIGALHEYKDNAKPHFLFYVVCATIHAEHERAHKLAGQALWLSERSREP